MKTDELVTLLATRAAPAPRHVAARRFALAMPLAIAAAMALMRGLYGIRPDLAVVAGQPLFWARLVFAAAMSVGALIVVLRLARPGRRVAAAWWGVAAPVLVLWAAAIGVLWWLPAESRAPQLLGHTWSQCAANITLLSIPALAALFWAVKGLAPTRLRLAGAATGLLGGAIATIAYCLHCPEMTVPFWAVWYVSGMAVPALAGAVLGPRLLRW